MCWPVSDNDRQANRPQVNHRAPDRHWVLASSNPGKIREFGQILEPLGVRLSPQAAFGIADAEEPHPTFVENALAKARHASRLAGLPGIADDSGLCVPALGGAPGVHSARYAALRPETTASEPTIGIDAALLARGRAVVDPANNRRLVAELQALGEGSTLPADEAARAWHAWYYCAIVFVSHPLDPCPVIAEGIWHGRIVAVARGEGGFGYDPHFLVDGEGATAAELPAARKNAISHRALALGRLLAALEAR